MKKIFIEESRKRCEKSGRSPLEPVKRVKIKEERMHWLLERNSFLLLHADSIMSELGEMLQESEYAVVLVDMEGYIIRKAGSMKNKSFEKYLEIGTNWSEQYMGTNAMGIVLREKQSIVIHGEHHYFRDYHILSCAAIPILGPDGSFYGGINISTRKENYHPLVFAFARTIAEVIQNKMKLEAVQSIEPPPVLFPTKTREELHAFQDLAGSCSKMKHIKTAGEKAAVSEFPVIIYGETGTGKELLAQSIHSAGSRKDKPFVAINCSAIPETLIESEFFGYEKGAFTGAKQRGHTGKFEAAEGGTVFLDEVGDLSMKAQGSLLRVLQEKSITKVGGVKATPINIRLLSATNKNLKKEIAEGRFREDLYYRLKGVFITMPPLREREDLLEIAEKILGGLENGEKKLTEKAKEKLAKYYWPGNIRELQSILMQASFLSDQALIEADAIQFEEAFEQWENRENIKTIEEMEAREIKKALTQLEGNVSKAADRLGLGRNTLYAKMKKYNLTN